MHIKEIFKHNTDFMKQCDIINKIILKSYLSKMKKNMLDIENEILF